MIFFVIDYCSGTSRPYESKVPLPKWAYGKWLTIGTTSLDINTVYINNTQLIIRVNKDETILHDLKLTRIISQNRQNENTIRLKARSFEQW